MKILWIILAVIAVLIIGTVLYFLIALPKKKDYANLTLPRIMEKETITVLKVSFDGDPSTIQEAFKVLYKTYYKLKNVPKGARQPAPLARYEFEEGTEDMSEEELKQMNWRGFAAIPVPEGTSLPRGAHRTARIEPLSYDSGFAAEMIHFGPYETEQPNIRKLKNYIEKEGYRITGLHEEEYILGPGLPFIGPKKYITFIRYEVEKKN